MEDNVRDPHVPESPGSGILAPLGVRFLELSALRLGVGGEPDRIRPSLSAHFRDKSLGTCPAHRRVVKTLTVLEME